LFVDGWEPEDVEKELHGLEEEYRDAARAEARRTCVRWVGTLLPKAAGWALAVSGHPHLKEPVSKSLEFVVGRFATSVQTQITPEQQPGAALDMTRAAYRNRDPDTHNNLVVPSAVEN